MNTISQLSTSYSDHAALSSPPLTENGGSRRGNRAKAPFQSNIVGQKTNENEHHMHTNFRPQKVITSGNFQKCPTKRMHKYIVPLTDYACVHLHIDSLQYHNVDQRK